LFGKVLDFGVVGIWMGIGCGCIASGISYCFILTRLDYKKIYEETLERLKHDENILTH
jgi:hypothetical protein